MGRSVCSSSAVLWLLLVFSLAITGCGGGGASGTVQPQEPEAAVRELIANWKNGENVPRLVLNASSSASIVYQTGGEMSASDTISFHDLSGNSWNFVIESITRPSEGRAEVRTSLSFGFLSSDPSASKAYITFIMLLDEGFWYLSDLILEIPTVIVIMENGIEGYLSEKNNPDVRLEGASVALYQNQVKIATTITDANGCYKFSNLAPGTYSLVFVGGGYETLTITDVVVNG